MLVFLQANDTSLPGSFSGFPGKGVSAAVVLSREESEGCSLGLGEHSHWDHW